MKKNRIIALIIFCISISVSGQKILTSEECRQLAVDNNKELKIASKNTQSASHQVKVARANYLPNFKLKGQAAYVNDLPVIGVPSTVLPQADFSSGKPVMKVDPATGKPVPSNAFFPGLSSELGSKKTYEMALALEQPLFTGGKITAGYKMSKIAKKIAENSEHLKKIDIILNSESAYWRLVSVNEKVKLAKSYRKLLEDLVRNLNNSYELELVNRNEVLKAKVKLNSAELKYIEADNALRLSKMALAEIIGVDLNSDIIAKDSIIDVPDSYKQESYLSTAIQNRREIVMLEDNVEINNQKVKMTRADYLPQLAVGANFISKAPNKYFEAKNEFTWNAGIKLSMNLFHWGERSNKMRMSKLKREISKLTLERNKELITLEVQQAYYKVQESTKKVQLAKNSLEQASENLKLSTDSFETGIINTTELLEAQMQWQQAHNDFIDSKIEFKINELSFKKAIGILN